MLASLLIPETMRKPLEALTGRLSYEDILTQLGEIYRLPDELGDIEMDDRDTYTDRDGSMERAPVSVHAVPVSATAKARAILVRMQ